MKSIPLKTWILWALILFILGLAADYYFLHVLFHSKQPGPAEEISSTKDLLPAGATGETAQTTSSPALTPTATPAATKDNFRESLQKCAPEIAAQGIGTPEALMEYLRKSVGVAQDDIVLENYHLKLADGSERRVQLVVDDNTNSKSKKELRFFTLDAEGYPQRLPLQKNATLQDLLALGKVTQHEVKSQLLLQDGMTLSLETHNDKVYEFQFNNQGQLLSCRENSCHCP